MKKAITIMAVAIGLTACKNTPKEAASAGARNCFPRNRNARTARMDHFV